MSKCWTFRVCTLLANGSGWMLACVQMLAEPLRRDVCVYVSYTLEVENVSPTRCAWLLSPILSIPRFLCDHRP